MWWGIGGGLLYLVVLLTLGLRTLKRGHGWMFFIGIFLPIFWLIGAFIGRTASAAADHEARAYGAR